MPVRCLLLAALCAAVSLVPAAPAGAAPTLRGCAGQPDFRCGTLHVPLDRSGSTQGAVGLRFAVEPARRGGPRRVLVFLTGGPGQASVSIASSLAISAAPALRRYRLAVLDQRGTGGSGLLRCPNLQGLSGLDTFTAAAVAACARTIGPRRSFYTTADSVLDIEELRKALGVPKIALMGISYGTYVALQYARAFPQRVERLVLDSIVGPGQPDGFVLESYAPIARVLRETCQRRACAGITSDPVADLTALVRSLGQGVLRGATFDARGRRRASSFREAEELIAVLQAGDLNPYLQAALPAALAAAADGDSAMLMRLRRPVAGGPTSSRELSFGVLMATNCTDARMPYSLQTPPAERPALAEAALAAIPAASYQPFHARTVLRASYVDACRAWPVSRVRPPYTGALPDVPALLLSGRLDLRTPLESALATASQLPRATLVAVRGTGHDVTDTDVSGCASIALERFMAGRAVRTPCGGQDNAVAPLPRPPRSLDDFRSAPGVGGRRGRAVFAALDSVADAYTAALTALYAGLGASGGGLHGGSFSAGSSFGGRITLRRYAYLPGLRLTGSVSTTEGRATGGTLRVQGLGLDGRLTFDRRGGVTGTLAGQRVRYAPSGARAASTRLTSAGFPPVTARVPPPR